MAHRCAVSHTHVSSGCPAWLCVVCRSFTALPVLASLLSATGLIATPIGVQTISSATLDDVLAWCMLAISSAFAKGDSNAGGVTVALSVAYIAFMFGVVRPTLARIHNYYRARNAEDSHSFLFLMILVLLSSALYCEVIQIHSFFGGFIAGLVAPKAGVWHIDTASRLELITREMLLPLFFVSSGSKTNISSIKGGTLIGAVFVVWAVATAGKFLPACLVTKLATGRSWRYATTVGILMNTRGLVELIALNVGYSLGILSQQLFSVLVLMALLTTFCTSPGVHLLWIASSEGRVEMAESRVVSDEYAEELSYQRSVAHLSLSDQDARKAEFKAEREKRKQMQPPPYGEWAADQPSPMSGMAGGLVPSSNGLVALSPLSNSLAPLPLPQLSDEQQRVETRYILHAMSSVSDLDMERAGDTQQVVFHPTFAQRELSRQRSSSHRGSLELEAHAGLAGVQPDDGGTPKHFLQSGGSLMRSGGSRVRGGGDGGVTTSQGRLNTSGSFRVDLQRQTVAEDAQEDSYTAPLNRSGPAGDGLTQRSGASRNSRPTSPRANIVGAAAGSASQSAAEAALNSSGSGSAGLTKSGGGRAVKRTPHPADQEN